MCHRFGLNVWFNPALLCLQAVTAARRDVDWRRVTSMDAGASGRCTVRIGCELEKGAASHGCGDTNQNNCIHGSRVYHGMRRLGTRSSQEYSNRYVAGLLLLLYFTLLCVSFTESLHMTYFFGISIYLYHFLASSSQRFLGLPHSIFPSC